MSNIEFISMIPGLEDIEECRPKPAKHFMPQWFKDVPNTLTPDQKTAPFGASVMPGISTVKICPSFPDYFSLGYILPMWCDTKLNYDENTDQFAWNTSSETFSWNIHTKNQFLQWADVSLHGDKAKFIFKASCPWRIITPKGWSVLQLPLFYHFNKDWSVLPGVIDTDIHNEINQQVLYHSDSQGISINRGDPFALYIPYQRDSKLGLEIRGKTESDDKMFKRKDVDISSKFQPNGLYRKWQRQRDKNS
jgi:hypothetical protein